MKIAVVGAGIMGQLLAYHCLQAGDEVTIYDDNDQANCSHAAAGMLSPAAELEKHDHLIYRLGMQSVLHHWPRLLQSLNANIYFQQRGSLLLAHAADQAELSRVVRDIRSKLQQEAAHHLADVTVASLEPQLVKFERGVYLQHEAQIDNQHLLSCLKDALLQRGARWCLQRVDDIRSHQISIHRIIHAYDLILDCRGLGAKQNFQSLRGIRGELIWLSAPDVLISRPVRLFHPRYSLYVVPRPDQQYILGASEIEAEDYSPLSVQSALELLTAAYYVHPAFAEARIIKTVTHCRPVLAHHLPEIQVRDGVIAVNGLYRHGFLIAPALAHEVMQFIQHGKSACQYHTLWQEAA